MISRTPEPEVMDTNEEALDYDAMDHQEVNAVFCDDFLAFAGPLGAAHVLDVGTGTARIPIELCSREHDITVLGIDLAAEMLAVGASNVREAGLGERIRLEVKDAKETEWDDAGFDAVISNSILHHIPEPSAVLGEICRLVKPGCAIFVRDLARPSSEAEVAALVAKYASGVGAEDAARAARQRDLFAASLRAALTVEEVRARVAPLGAPAGSVQLTSDRHWTLAFRKGTA